jgi:hypothetical protein
VVGIIIKWTATQSNCHSTTTAVLVNKSTLNFTRDRSGSFYYFLYIIVNCVTIMAQKRSSGLFISVDFFIILIFMNGACYRIQFE